MTNTLTLVLAVILCLTVASPALALGTEGRGNAPLASGMVKHAALLPMANHKSRVYWREVNGDLYCFYRGDTATLNEFLKLFAATKEPVREAILLPGPGETMTFDRSTIACDWQVHFANGFYLHAASKEQGTQVMDKHPTLTVFVTRVAPQTPIDAKQVQRLIDELNDDKFAVREAAWQELAKIGHATEAALRRALDAKPPAETARRIETLLEKLTGIDLNAVRLPEGIAVLELSDLIARRKAGLKSEDSQIRGFAVGDLGGYAKYTDETIPLVIDVLKTGKHEYVRRCAAGSLSYLGARARPALPVLKEGLKDPDKNIQHMCQQVLEMIDKGDPAGRLDERQVELREQISKAR